MEVNNMLEIGDADVPIEEYILKPSIIESFLKCLYVEEWASVITYLDEELEESKFISSVVLHDIELMSSTRPYSELVLDFIRDDIGGYDNFYHDEYVSSIQSICYANKVALYDTTIKMHNSFTDDVLTLGDFKLFMREISS